MCTYDSDPTMTPVVCGPDDFCGVDNISYVVDTAANKENIINWYTQAGLMCKPHSVTAMIGTVAFAGVFLGCLIIPRLGDLYGRKPVYLGSMIVQGPVLLIVCLTDNLKLLYVVVFIFGASIIGRMSCGFLLLMEHVPREK